MVIGAQVYLSAFAEASATFICGSSNFSLLYLFLSHILELGQEMQALAEVALG